MAEPASLLKKVSIFTEVSEEELKGLAASLHVRHFEHDEVILSREEKGDALFLIDKGKVKIALYGANGREMILAILGPGQFFGEMSLFDRNPRSAYVIAMENTSIYVLPRRDLIAHIHRSPETALGIISELIRRLRSNDELIGGLALLDVNGRVARALLGLAKTEGKQVEEGLYIRRRPTQQDLAAMVGASRETVSRALSELSRRGFIVISGRSVLIRQERSLAEEFDIDL